MRKIRILYTIPNFDTAGSGKVVYDLVRGLDTELFEVEIACSHNKGSFFKEVEQLHVPTHLINTTTTYRPLFSLFNRLKPIIKFFKAHDYDIVHSWHWSSDCTEVLAARLAGVKWVYTKKAMSWGNKHWKIRSYLADYIITINDQMKVYFPKKKHQKLIPLGIDTNYYHPNIPNKQDSASSTFQIITVANLVPVKGVEILILALKKLNNPDIRLTVLGDDTTDYGVALKNLCKTEGLENQIDFLGKHLDIRPYLGLAELYVIPTLSKGEGMPMALVEAMSMGIPVLGSDVSGINFVLKDFPELLFESGNVDGLAYKINMIFQNSKAQNKALGENLRFYCEQHFSYERFIKSHETLYQTIIRKKFINVNESNI